MDGDDFRPQPKPQRGSKGTRKRLGNSDRRQDEKFIYRLVRLAYLAGLAAGQGRRGRRPLCERCGENVVEHVHHRRGKEGTKLNEAEDFSGLCRRCHDWVHANPLKALAEGWMVSRNAARDT